MIRKRIAVFQAGLVLVVSSSPSFADVYQFSFSGAVTRVDSDLAFAGAPGIGTPISGSFQYDTSIPMDPISRPGEAVYATPLLPYSFVVGALRFSGVGQQGVQNVGVDVSNNYFGSSNDVFSFTSFTGAWGNAPGSGTSVGGYSLSQLSIVLTDSTGTVFNSIALPTSLSINSFDDRFVRLFYFNDSISASRSLDTDITSFSVTPVPVPTPVVGTGLPGMLTVLSGSGFFAWWRRRQTPLHQMLIECNPLQLLECFSSHTGCDSLAKFSSMNSSPLLKAGVPYASRCNRTW